MKSRLYELNLFRKESTKESNLEYSLKFCKYVLSYKKEETQTNKINVFLMKNHKTVWLDLLNTGNSIYAMYSHSLSILTYYIFRLINGRRYQYNVFDVDYHHYDKGYKLLERHRIECCEWYGKNIIQAQHTVYC